MSSNTALITGASAGIGLELARIHAARGGDLVLVARREDKLDALRIELETAHGIRVHVMARDLVAPGAGRRLHADLREAGIEVDLLINNAGFGGSGLFHDRPLEDDLSMIQLNVIALVELTRCLLPDFLSRGRGRILNVSSTASLFPGGPLQAVYFATKAFVTSFSYGLAGELKGSPVTVTALLPGATATEFAEVSGLEKSPLFQRPVPARGVAQEGYDAMLEGRLDVISGLSAVRRAQVAMSKFAPKGYVLDEVLKVQQTR